MNLNIKTTNYDLTPEIRDYLEKKLAVLDKFMDTEGDAVLAHVELGKTTRHHKSGNVFKAEINLRSNGHNFIATAEEEDLHAAIDKMKDNLIEEVKTGKDKFKTNLKKGGAELKEEMRNEESNTDNG